MKLMFRMLINLKVFCKVIVLALMGLARHAQTTRVNLHYLCDTLRKKSGMKLWDLTAQAGSNATLIIYYASSVLPPVTLFLPHYGIHTKPFRYLINCLCNIRSLLF